MKIVITGALGHIGSKLIRELPSRLKIDEIILIDNLLTQRYCSLFDLPSNTKYQFIEADILKQSVLPYLNHASAVIHLAAITDAANSFGNAEAVEAVNFQGTQNIAEACIEANVPLLFPSTTSVYGTQAQIVDENCGPDELKPQSPYAESKLKAENLLSQLGKEHGLKFVTCRLGTIFGTSPGMRFHTAINKFCWQAVQGTPITVWRTALNQNRPYLDLIDCVRAIAFLLEKKLFDGQIYNVVTTNTSVGKIVEQIQSQIPNTNIQYVDTAIMNQLSYHVANQRFLKLGFQFQGELSKGISETIALIKSSASARLKV